MRVRLAAEADEFLRSEVAYLVRRSPRAARQLVADIRRARRPLGEFPWAGPAKADLVPGTRRLVVPPCVLTCEVSGDAVQIFAIHHGRMRFPEGDDGYDEGACPP